MDKNKPNKYTGKLSDWLHDFFFGRYNENAKATLHLIKRLFWCAVVVSAIRYWFYVVTGFAQGNILESLSILAPAIVATGIAVLFINFE